MLFIFLLQLLNILFIFKKGCDLVTVYDYERFRLDSDKYLFAISFMNTTSGSMHVIIFDGIKCSLALPNKKFSSRNAFILFPLFDRLLWHAFHGKIDEKMGKFN